MSHLVLDSSDIERHKSIAKFEKTKAINDAAVKDDWARNGATYKDDAGRPTTEALAQMGRPFHRTEIEKRLLKCNPNFIFEISKADATKSGIYIIKCVADEQGIWRSTKVFLVGMESGISPEFSVRHVAEEEVPNPSCPGEMTKRPKFIGETRGWRTVVARLVRSKHLELESAMRNFEIDSSKNSENWKNLTT